MKMLEDFKNRHSTSTREPKENYHLNKCIIKKIFNDDAWMVG
jgi:hypothetical protein